MVNGESQQGLFRVLIAQSGKIGNQHFQTVFNFHDNSHCLYLRRRECDENAFLTTFCSDGYVEERLLLELTSVQEAVF